MKKSTSSPEQSFVERFGLLLETEGFPRIAGRIMAFLLLTDAPCRADDLATELKISHGSVSTNTRLLERFGILERVSMPGDRATYYRVTRDPYGSILAEQLERMRRLHALVAETRRALGGNSSAQADGASRLSALERFYRMAIRSTEDLLDNWELAPAAPLEEPDASDS